MKDFSNKEIVIIYNALTENLNASALALQNMPEKRMLDPNKFNIDDLCKVKEATMRLEEMNAEYLPIINKLDKYIYENNL